jgi:hypothetical protein
VPGSPSTAAVAGKAALSVEDAVAGRPRESSWSSARAGDCAIVKKHVASSARIRQRAVRDRAAPDSGLDIGARDDVRMGSPKRWLSVGDEEQRCLRALYSGFVLPLRRTVNN